MSHVSVSIRKDAPIAQFQIDRVTTTKLSIIIQFIDILVESLQSFIMSVKNATDKIKSNMSLIVSNVLHLFMVSMTVKNIIVINTN
jgi:hypothetical protein